METPDGASRNGYSASGGISHPDPITVQYNTRESKIVLENLLVAELTNKYSAIAHSSQCLERTAVGPCFQPGYVARLAIDLSLGGNNSKVDKEITRREDIWRTGCTSPGILKFGTRWRLATSCTPWLHKARKKEIEWVVKSVCKLCSYAESIPISLVVRTVTQLSCSPRAILIISFSVRMVSSCDVFLVTIRSFRQKLTSLYTPWVLRSASLLV